MTLLQCIIAAGFLYFTFRHINIKSIITNIENVNYWFLILALVPQGISLFILAAREKYLLHNLYEFSFLDLLRGVFISLVGNNVLPLRAGEFLKAYYWAKCSNCTYTSLVSIAMLERILDLITLVILFFIGSKTILFHLGVHATWVIALCTLMITPVLFLFFWDKKSNGQIIMPRRAQAILGETLSNHCHYFLSNIAQGLCILKSTRNMILAMLLTIIYWGTNIAGIYFTLLAFHLHFTLSACIVVLLATSLGAAIPSAPGYIGTYDYFAKMPLVLYGINTTTAASFALVSHALIIIPFTLVGLFFVLGPLQKIARARQYNNDLTHTLS